MEAVGLAYVPRVNVIYLSKIAVSVWVLRSL